MSKRAIEKSLLLLGCVLGLSYGLEFGSMGNTSAGIGGAGVAVKDSAWGLYYNPALLGADRRAKFGYSFGLTMKEQNLLQMLNIDTENLSNFSTTLNDQLMGSGGSGKTVSIGGTTIDGALGGALDALFPNPQTPGEITANDLSKLLQELEPTTTTCASFAACAATISGNTDLANKLKGRLTDAANKGGSPLIGDIISGIDATKLGDVLDGLNTAGSTADIADKILESAGTLTIKKGADSTIDRLLDDFKLVDNALKGIDMNISSQNGFVFQIAGERKTRTINDDKLGQITIKESAGGRGALAFGLFSSIYANASMILDPTYKQLIFDLGGKYYEANISGNNIALETSTQNDYDTSSILSKDAQHTLQAQTLALVEIPIGYGHTFFTKAGDVNFGFAVKFIEMLSYGFTQNNINFDDPNIDIPSPTFPDSFDISQTAGLDMGLLYTPTFQKNFSIGLVAKNLNAPMLKLSKNGSGDFTLKPQVRAGVSYVLKDFLTFALDVDLLPNKTLSHYSPKSQMIGGGVMANFKWVDLRVGAMQDIQSHAGEGLILTGGFNLFGFLDLSVQYGLDKTFMVQDMNLSNYLSVKLGGSFSF